MNAGPSERWGAIVKSLADGLPPEIAEQIHPDWRKNEADFWGMREELLPHYKGQWIGFAHGKVVACGNRPVTVMHAAAKAAEHPFVTCVGFEDVPTRMRRVNFAYDKSYPGGAAPRLHRRVSKGERRGRFGIRSSDSRHGSGRQRAALD